MAGRPAKELRCAIYTRKSTDHGLELEFNSLDAQREACQSYIASQASQGWRAVVKRYDDPAYSGGNMDRPALQRLLKDIEAGQIDVVVVYKIDRLTRSLADFAKLVEAFDAKSISFVAVTQQFNTTTSMGRLTLNVLLSFAQFERELASERVRDKIAASRKKGKWTGGSVPLGYNSRDKKLVVNATEAKTVRMIFARYLALQSLQKLIDELNEKGILTKKRPANGKHVGGIPFTNGPLAYVLKNRTYLGETGHDGRWFRGEHEWVIDRSVFDQVQRLLKANSAVRAGRRQPTDALLTGLIFDERGNRLSPSFTTKKGVRYPFYVSSALSGGLKHKVGSARRVPAAEIEAAVLQAVRNQDEDSDQADELTSRQLIERRVGRIAVNSDQILVTLNGRRKPLKIAWTPKPPYHAQIENGGATEPHTPDPQLIQAVVRANIWLRSLSDGTHESIEDLAQDAKLHPKVIRNRIRLAFLAPDVVKRILQGSQKTTSLGELSGLTQISWRKQRMHLGVKASQPT